MRLIDADKIDFSKVFGGHSEFAKDLIAAAQELIDIQPTVFDKEKVHSELIELRNAEVFKPDFATKYEEGRYSAFLDAIRIVEKGGIE